MVGQINGDYIRLRFTKFFSRMISYGLFEGRPVTTKGQWINPLVFAHLAFAKTGIIKRKVTQPAYILGTGRSGTTILGIVMSMHKNVAFLNEPKAMWHSVFPHEDLIGSYSIGAADYLMDASHVSPKQQLQMHNMFGYYLATVFSSQLLDKYPELVFRMEFVKKIFPDFKAIFLYRNGWDTAISSAGWSDIHGQQVDGDTHNWWGVNNRKWNLMCDQLVAIDPELKTHTQTIKDMTSEVDKSVVEWIVSMKYGMDACRKYPDHVMPIRYEDLAAMPEETVTKVCNFLSLPHDPALIQYAKQTLKPVPSKKPVALHPAIEQPFLAMMKAMNY